MTVTFFGHRDTPKEAEKNLRYVLIDLIENHGATNFLVGNNGNFDITVRHQLEALSKNYQINYSIVLAYMPVKKNEYIEYTNTLIPEEIEKTPKRFAISYRNKWMLNQSDAVITYVNHNYGGAYQFKNMAVRQGKRVIELAK